MEGDLSVGKNHQTEARGISRAIPFSIIQHSSLQFLSLLDLISIAPRCNRRASEAVSISPGTSFSTAPSLRFFFIGAMDVNRLNNKQNGRPYRSHGFILKSAAKCFYVRKSRNAPLGLRCNVCSRRRQVYMT